MHFDTTKAALIFSTGLDARWIFSVWKLHVWNGQSLMTELRDYHQDTRITILETDSKMSFQKSCSEYCTILNTVDRNLYKTHGKIRTPPKSKHTYDIQRQEDKQHLTDVRFAMLRILRNLQRSALPQHGHVPILSLLFCRILPSEKITYYSVRK